MKKILYGGMLLSVLGCCILLVMGLTYGGSGRPLPFGLQSRGGQESAAEHTAQAEQSSRAVAAAADGNWGLSFQQEGSAPIGNATPEYLAKFQAYYIGAGDPNAKKIYLTFDAGYENGVTDEFVEPNVCDKDGMISDNDSVIFFNYRPDRAREITRAFVDPAFDGFKREYFPLTYVCNTEYDATMPNVLVAFPRISVKNGLGEYLSKMGMTQLRIAETEKYAHVTFFFNGGVEEPYPGEDRVLVASPKVATYDLQPEMSAHEVADKCVERIESGKYDVIILNFANCDMVGHTGVFDAAVKAVETVDECVGQVVEATLKMGGIAMITADHGNAEQMLQSDGKSPMTAHTTNVVPFILCGAGTELREGRLADIAPTILDVMGLEKPTEMDGKTLIVR